MHTRNGKQLTIEEISSNLALLLQHSTQVPTNMLTSLNQESLVGKKVRHRWCNLDGTEQWYTGRILSVVPGTTEWFNVQYDGEQEVLSLNLYILILIMVTLTSLDSYVNSWLFFL